MLNVYIHHGIVWVYLKITCPAWEVALEAVLCVSVSGVEHPSLTYSSIFCSKKETESLSRAINQPPITVDKCLMQETNAKALDLTWSPPSLLLLDTPTFPKKETHELRGTDLGSQPQHSYYHLLLTTRGFFSFLFIMSHNESKA